MNLSAPFIRRPVATILLSIALTLSGLFAYRFLPVAALPTVDFPTISVTAQLPGASPESMAASVATPLIKEFSTIPSIATISATNYQGFTSITVEFELSRNIDQAAADVQAAITRTLRRLPIELTIPPSFRKLNPADAPVILLALSSETTPLPTLDAFAQTVISPSLSTITASARCWSSAARNSRCGSSSTRTCSPPAASASTRSRRVSRTPTPRPRSAWSRGGGRTSPSRPTRN